MTSLHTINNALLNLWKSPSAKHQSLAPIQYPDAPDHPVVFVGLNPSSSAQGWHSLSKHMPSKPTLPSLVAWPNNNFQQADVVAWEKVALTHYPYFKPHRDLASIAGKNWIHLDLFSIRETSQAKLVPQVISSLRPITLNKFGLDQLDIFDQAICLVRPAAVIVVNALASRIYADRRGLGYDSKCCCHTDKCGEEGHEFPVFLSGMLTGQRALDIYSRERLFCHVARCFNRSQYFHNWRATLSKNAEAGELDDDNCRS